MAAAAVAYVATFLNSAMIASRSIRAQSGLFAVVLATGFLTCWYFVPRYSLTGAAWATGLTLLVQLAGAASIVARAVWHLGRRPVADGIATEGTVAV
jgi:O-antigen/teichoic acid export membrane protein